MLRIAVCAGASDFRAHLLNYISRWAKKRALPVTGMGFASGEELLFEIENSGDFSMVFMEMELSGITGMETARAVRRQNRLTALVFLFVSMEHFQELCGIYPAPFLYKPLTGEKVRRVLECFLEERKYFRESFPFRFNRRFYMIDLSMVLYFVSQGRKIRIFLEDGREYEFYDRLDVVERALKQYRSRFVRIHQSYLVNAGQIEQYQSTMVRLKNQCELPISRKRRRSDQFPLRFL